MNAWFWRVLIVASACSLALSVWTYQEPRQYPRLWHLDLRDVRGWTDEEIDAVYRTEQYEHLAVFAREEAARQQLATLNAEIEAHAQSVTEHEQLEMAARHFLMSHH